MREAVENRTRKENLATLIQKKDEEWREELVKREEALRVELKERERAFVND